MGMPGVVGLVLSSGRGDKYELIEGWWWGREMRGG